MQRKHVSLGLILLLVVVGLFAVNKYVSQPQKPGEMKQTLEKNVAYEGTFTGEYVCLPHKNMDGPQTMECALGIRTDANEYYALDFNLMPEAQTSLATGDRFTAEGLITPIELLSANHWQTYGVKGIFTIKGSLQKL